MASTILPFEHPVSAGEVLDAGFRLFKVSLIRCLPLSLAAVVVGQLPAVFALAAGRSPSMPADMGAAKAFVLVLAGLATLVLWRATILRQHSMACGQRSTLRQDFARPLAGLLSAVVVLLAGNLVLLLALALAVAPLGAPAALGALDGSAVAPLVAGLLLALPGTYLSIVSWFAYLAGVIEGASIRTALRHGLRLLRGNWWRTAGILTIGSFAALIFYTVGSVVGLILAQAFGGGDVGSFVLAASVATALIGALIMPFMCALSLAQYADLRLRSEGVDLARRIESLSGG